MKKIIIICFLLISLSNAKFLRDDNKSVVIDNVTKLMWQDDSDVKTTKRNWNDSISYCENLTLGGYTNWYMPNFNELYSIADKTKHEPAISDIFKNSHDYGTYFSSTTHSTYNSASWGVDFLEGGDVFALKSFENYIRCVRTLDDI